MEPAEQNNVDSFAMLYGNRRHLDGILPPLPRLSWNPPSREQTFGRPVPMRDTDNLGLVFDDEGPFESVLPPLSCNFRKLSLSLPSPSILAPDIPGQHGLLFPSKLLAFVLKVKKALSRRPKPQQLPEKVTCIARPCSESIVKPKELLPKRVVAGMPSDELVVIQIVRCNYLHHHGRSKPLPLEERPSTLSSSSKITALPISKQVEYHEEIFENNKSESLAESQVEGLEIPDNHNELAEVAGQADRDILDEVNGVFTAESSTTHKVGGDTADESLKDGKECTESPRLDIPSDEEYTGYKSNTGRDTDEGEGEDTSHISASDISSDKENVVAQEIGDDIAANNNQRKGEDRRDRSASDAVFGIANITRQNDIADRAKESGGKLQDQDRHSTSELLLNTKNAHQVHAGGAAGTGEEDTKDSRESSNFDAMSETSSAHESDGGVALDEIQEDWSDSRNRSTPHDLANERTARQGNDVDEVENLKKEREVWAESSTSDYFTADESIQTEDTSDEVEPEAEPNRILEDDSPSLPFERDYRSSGGNEAAADGTDGDSADTSSEKENSSPSSLASSSTLQYGPRQLEDSRHHNGDIENSHFSSDSYSGSSVDEGPWVMVLDQRGGLEAHRVSPVAFNVCQLRRSDSTPSIQSRESELDNTSPLFQKPSAPVTKPACREHPDPSTSGESGEAGRLVKGKTSLDVWRDDSNEVRSGAKPMLRRKPDTVFRDVSNTRQVLCNAQGTRGDQVLGNKTKEIGRTWDDVQRTSHLHSFAPCLQPPLTSSYTETPQTGHDASETLRKSGHDPIRAVLLAASLAALEGKVSPSPGTPEPLIRCARREYGPDVLVEWSAPLLVHPKPIRPWLGEKAVTNLEKQVASADWMCSATETGPQTASSQPTPTLGHRRPMRFENGERTTERLEKRVARPTWTSSFTVTKPQITRPSNPTPDAARHCHRF